MEFDIGVFIAGPTEFENAVQFPAVFSFETLGSQNITITSTDNVLNIGDGLAGPGIGANATVDEIFFRTITTSQGDFDVAVILSDASNNALIVPVDPVGGTITTDILPLETGITVGAELGVTSYLLEPPNTPPVADDLSTSVDEDMVLNGTVTGSDAEDDDATLTFALGTDATNGSAVVNGNGTFSYTPDANFDGPDSFTFTVTDSDGASSTGTVTITVNNTDIPTMATVVAYLVPDGDIDAAIGGFGNGTLVLDPVQPVEAMIDSSDDILSDDDVVTAPTINGLAIETLQFRELTLGMNAPITVAILGFAGVNNSLIIPLDAGGVAGIALEAGDYAAGTALADPMAMLMNTELPNTPPVADDLSISVDEDTVLNGTVTGSDAEDDDTTLTFALATDATNGTATVNGNGTFTYTPDADYDGPDSFTFTVTDSDGASTTGTVTVTVEPVGEVFTGDDTEQDFVGTVGLVDTADYSASAAAVFIFLSGADGDTSTGSAGDAEGDDLTSIENFIGSSSDDIIFALTSDAVDNTLEGGNGNDILSGGLGSDSLSGGEGNDILDGSDDGTADVLDGGIGLDVASYSNATSGINFDLGDPNNPPNPLAGPGEIDQDQLISIEGLIGASGFSNTLIGDGQDNVLIGGDLADSLSGNAGNDVISGLAGDDIIDGGAGIDILVGEQGTDTLTGGGDADMFDIQLNSDTDIITDFEVGTDMIRFFGTGLGFLDLEINQNGADVDITVMGLDLLVRLQNRSEADIDNILNFDFV